MNESRKARRLTNLEFLKLCDVVRNAREEVMKDVHNVRQFSEWLKDKTNIEIGTTPASRWSP